MRCVINISVPFGSLGATLENKFDAIFRGSKLRFRKEGGTFETEAGSVTLVESESYCLTSRTRMSAAEIPGLDDEEALVVEVITDPKNFKSGIFESSAMGEAGPAYLLRLPDLASVREHGRVKELSGWREPIEDIARHVFKVITDGN